MVAMWSGCCNRFLMVINEMMAQNNLKSNTNRWNLLTATFSAHKMKSKIKITLYDDVAFDWSSRTSSISRKRNLNSTKCRTIHLRSSEHSSVFKTSSLHFSIAVDKSSTVASWSSTNCHCSLIKLLGMACDLSEPSSPDITDESWSVVGLVGSEAILVVVPSIGEVAIFVLVIKLLNVFGMLAMLPRNDCIPWNEKKTMSGCERNWNLASFLRAQKL